MDDAMNQLIEQARKRHHFIFPCFGKNNIRDCFTTIGNTLVFWYNAENESTYTVSCKIAAD